MNILPPSKGCIGMRLNIARLRFRMMVGTKIS